MGRKEARREAAGVEEVGGKLVGVHGLLSAEGLVDWWSSLR